MPPHRLHIRRSSVFRHALTGLILFCGLFVCARVTDAAGMPEVRVERPYHTAEQREDAGTLALAAANRELREELARALLARQEVRFAWGMPGQNAKIPDPVALACAVYDIKGDLVFRGDAAGGGSAIATARLTEDMSQERLIAILADSEKLDLYVRAAARERELLDALAAFPDLPPAPASPATQKLPDSGPNPIPSPAARLRAVEAYLTLLPQLRGIWQDPQRVHGAMTEAMSLDPDCALYPNAAGDAALLLGLGHEAMEYQTLATRLDPGFARAFHSRGAAHLALQLPALAVNDFSEAIRLSPENAAYRLDRAAAWKLQDETEFMCADLYEACALGDCRTYEWAVAERLCPVQGPEENQ